MRHTTRHMALLCGGLVLGSLLSSAAVTSARNTVAVANPDGSGGFPMGYTCLIDPLHAVFQKHAWDGLALYLVTEALPGGGRFRVECPVGTLFLEVPSTVERWQNEAQIGKDIRENEKRKMRRFLEAK